MDIICGKTGKHFNDISILRECEKHCDSCDLKPFQKPKINIPASQVYISSNTTTEPIEERIELLVCPNCARKALHYFIQILRYECANCHSSYTKIQYEAITRSSNEE